MGAGAGGAVGASASRARLSPDRIALQWRWHGPAGCGSPAALNFLWVQRGTVRSRKQEVGKVISNNYM